MDLIRRERTRAPLETMRSAVQLEASASQTKRRWSAMQIGANVWQRARVAQAPAIMGPAGAAATLRSARKFEASARAHTHTLEMAQTWPTFQTLGELEKF